MSFGGDTGPGEIDLSCPINWGHPDNAGLALCLSAVGGTAGGARFLDLCRLGDQTAGGTLVNGPTWVGTPWGQRGLSSIGGVGAANVPNSSVFDGPPITLASWVLVPSGNTGESYIFSNYPSRWTFGTLTASAKMGLYPGSGGWVVSNTSVNDGFWHRWGVSITATGALTFYLDGKPDGTASVTIAGTRKATLAYGCASRYIAGGIVLAGVAADARWFARDYQWSRDPATDPRLNRITGRTYFAPLSATPSVFAPAFGPGWGFAA